MSKPALPLSQDRIVEAAVKLLEKDGFDAFNMRTLAAELGVVASAIYRHAGGKEDILELAADRILDTISTSGSMSGQEQDWRTALTENASAYRQLFKQYPGVAAYLTMHLGTTPTRQQAIQHSINILTRAGQSRAEAMRTAAVLNAFIRASAGDGDSTPKAKAGRSSSKPDSKMLALDDASFQHGLSLLIAGIETSIIEACDNCPKRTELRNSSAQSANS